MFTLILSAGRARVPVHAPPRLTARRQSRTYLMFFPDQPNRPSRQFSTAEMCAQKKMTVEETAGEAAEEIAAADHQNEQDRSADELPALEARDAIQLFAQSPAHLFLHWSHAADPFAALRDAFADAASHYRLTVRLSNLTDAAEHLFDASPARAQWLPALPGRDYRADLGFHADGLPFVTLLSSAAVTTPRAAVSPDADAAPEFRITYEDFARLLEQTGYPLGTLERPTTHDARAAIASSYCHFSSPPHTTTDH